MKNKLNKIIYFFMILLIALVCFSSNAQETEERILEQNFDFDKQEEQIEPEIRIDNKAETQKSPLLKGHISKVPGGTKLKIILETPIDEITSMVDDEITARTSENIEVDGKVIIPAGS